VSDWWQQQDNEAWHQHVILANEFRDETRNYYTQRQDMKVRDMIVNKFLAKSDFDEDQICTIRGLKQENVGKEDSPELRWTLYFTEHKKAMVLNVTSIRVLEAAFGDESDNWKGKKVTVYVDPNVSFQGRVVGGLRLRPIKEAKTAPKVSTAAQTEPPDELDDEIPF
jgi:hypothetical protein